MRVRSGSGFIFIKFLWGFVYGGTLVSGYLGVRHVYSIRWLFYLEQENTFQPSLNYVMTEGQKSGKISLEVEVI